MNGPTEGIRFERNGRLGVVVLDRQESLNTLTRAMVQALSLQLLDWREEPEIAAVLVKAAPGRAFCAGGDIRHIYEARRAGHNEEAFAFFREEYRLNWRVFRYPKPYIALLDGIVMGGGVGISVHGSHRVVSERARLAMPETRIGFFPDVGATYFLPRCPGELGTYLGLLGATLEAADCIHAGIGTQHVPSDRLDGLESALSTLPAGAHSPEVDALIAGFTAPPGDAPLADERERIDACFVGDSLEEIVAALERDASSFGSRTLDELRQRSPLSLHITLAQLRKGAPLTFEEALQLEFRLARRFVEGHELVEGVRAQLIDKDRQPHWTHPDIAAVPQEVVDAYFAPLDGDELSLDWQGL